MKTLFVGEYSGNTGPANVNRSLIENWPRDDEVLHIESSSKLGQILEGFAKGVRCDVVLFTNNSMVDVTLHSIFRRLQKTCVCFNHGYAPMENDINRGSVPKRRMEAIKHHMRTSDALVANSELQMNLLRDQLGQCRGLLTYVNLGVDRFAQMSVYRNNRRPVVAVSGGTRLIKANEVVVQAIALLKERGIDCVLRVYGRGYAPNDDLAEAFASGDAVFMGQVPQKEFVEQLGEVDVFVMNSRHEPFGLSAIDAIHAGCSLLLSRNCGVGGVLALEEGDVVLDCENAREVADKIERLLSNPNSERLYRSLNFDDLSWERTAGRLREVCVTAFSRNVDYGQLN